MPMKMIERAAIVGGVIAGATLAAPQASAAVKIDDSNFGACLGSTSCTAISGATITPQTTGSIPPNPTLAIQTFSVTAPDVQGLGVNSNVDAGSSANEAEFRINGTESILIEFDTALPIAEVHIAHFYNRNSFGTSDEPDERLKITGTSNTGNELVFQLLHEDTGLKIEQDDGGSAIATFGDLDADGDLVNISNLFAGTSIASLLFEPLSGVAAGTNDESDFSIASVAQVPLPAAAWLMIGGLGAVAAAARRQRKTAA